MLVAWSLRGRPPSAKQYQAEACAHPSHSLSPWEEPDDKVVFRDYSKHKIVTAIMKPRALHTRADRA